MSVENFQVERTGKIVRIWLDSGADIENCMVAFCHEFDSEIEADLVSRNITESVSALREECYDMGIDAEKRAWTNNAAEYFEANADIALKAASRFIAEGK